MKNLVIIHPHFYHFRGASKFILEIARRLAKQGLKVSIIAAGGDREIIKNYPDLNFVFLAGRSTGDWGFWLRYPLFQIRFHLLLNKIPDKVLFPQVMPANHWALLYKKFHPHVPLIWMCQEPSAFIHSIEVINSLKEPARSFLKVFRPLLVIIDKWLIGSADFIFANSVFGASLIEKTYSRKADLIAYPSVDLKRFKPFIKKENYILAVSHLDKQKRINILIKAFSLLADSIRQENRLFIAGEGKERKNLEDMVTKLNLDRSVVFLDKVREEDLPRLYSQAKIVVFPAFAEPFGIVPLEAMASGTPVIATRGGGTEETIIDNKTGFLVEPDDSEIIAQKIDYLLNHPFELQKMSKEARLHMEKNFSWDKTSESIKIFLMEKVF